MANDMTKAQVHSALMTISMVLMASCPGVGWTRTESGRIVVFSRPAGFAGSPSPSGGDIELVIAEQEREIERFERLFGVRFAGKVTIRLFNADEQAEESGVSNGGGHAVPDSASVFCRFVGPVSASPGKARWLGGHEIAHVLSHSMWGKSDSRIVSEGFATWFDGYYGTETVDGNARAKSCAKWMEEYAGRGQVLPARALIGDAFAIEERFFYPQSASFVEWIVETKGAALLPGLFRETARDEGLETLVRRIYGKRLSELLGEVPASYRGSAGMWLTETYGMDAFASFERSVASQNMAAVASVLGMIPEDIDREYARWLAEGTKAASRPTY